MEYLIPHSREYPDVPKHIRISDWCGDNIFNDGALPETIPTKDKTKGNTNKKRKIWKRKKDIIIHYKDNVELGRYKTIREASEGSGMKYYTVADSLSKRTVSCRDGSIFKYVNDSPYSGTVYIPSCLWRDNHPADMLSFFAEALSDEFGWKLICSPQLNVKDIEGDILFTIKSPQHAFPDVLINIDSLPDSVYYVAYIQDIHGGEEFVNKRLKVALDRSDLILITYRDVFYMSFPEYMHKTEYVPAFIAPTSRYLSLEIGEKKDKGLITGYISDFYPLRRAASKSPLFDVIPHPGYHNINKKKDIYVGDNYAELINSYLFSLTDITVQEYVVCKLFEIMASGTVLMSDWCSEMADLGFEDGVNYVKVDCHNFEAKARDLLNNKDLAYSIIKNGRAFVMSNFTLEKRISDIRGILENKGVVV